MTGQAVTVTVVWQVVEPANEAVKTTVLPAPKTVPSTGDTLGTALPPLVVV